MTETLKVRFQRGTQIFDKGRAVMVIVTKGQEIELDIEDQESRLMVWEIVCSGRVVVTDGRIPASAQYFILHTENYVCADGTRVTLFPGKEITLEREIAAKFLISAHVRAINPAAWIPSDLVRPRGATSAEVKRMYDPEPEPSNWIRKHIRKE